MPYGGVVQASSKYLTGKWAMGDGRWRRVKNQLERMPTRLESSALPWTRVAAWAALNHRQMLMIRPGTGDSSSRRGRITLQIKVIEFSGSWICGNTGPKNSHRVPWHCVVSPGFGFLIRNIWKLLSSGVGIRDPGTGTNTCWQLSLPWSG